MQTARKILFYLFLLLYLVFCPILILYSFGYIFNPVNKRLSQTGLIHLETIPSGADIFLGKSHYRYRTPASITDLLPGRYDLALKLKGHRLWSHEVSIEKGAAAVFDDILLLPKRLNPDILIPASTYRYLIFLPETDTLLLKKGPQLKDCFIFDWRKRRSQPLLRGCVSCADVAVSDIYPRTEDGEMIAVGDKGFYLIDSENKKQAVTEITKLFDGKPDEIIWNAASQNSCFARYGDRIDRLDLKEMLPYPRFIEDVKGFGVSAKYLYVLGKDGRISKMALDETQRAVSFEGKKFGEGLFGRSRFYKIQFLEGDILLFLGENGDLIATLPPYKLMQGGVLGTGFYKGGKKFLFWSKNAIGVADFSGEDAEKPLSAGRIAVQTVYEGGKGISQCFWVYNGAHIIFRDRHEVFLIELAFDGKHHIEHIVKVKDGTDILYSDETGSLYYLDPNGRMAGLKIIPVENMIAVSLIEKDKTKERQR